MQCAISFQKKKIEWNVLTDRVIENVPVWAFQQFEKHVKFCSTNNFSILIKDRFQGSSEVPSENAVW